MRNTNYRNHIQSYYKSERTATALEVTTLLLYFESHYQIHLSGKLFSLAQNSSNHAKLRFYHHYGWADSSNHRCSDCRCVNSTGSCSIEHLQRLRTQDWNSFQKRKLCGVHDWNWPSHQWAGCSIHLSVCSWAEWRGTPGRLCWHLVEISKSNEVKVQLLVHIKFWRRNALLQFLPNIYFASAIMAQSSIYGR